MCRKYGVGQIQKLLKLIISYIHFELVIDRLVKVRKCLTKKSTFLIRIETYQITLKWRKIMKISIELFKDFWEALKVILVIYFKTLN